MKREQKEKAIEMRKNGASLGQISKKLLVSKGSVSLWTKGIVLTDEQQEKLDTHLRHGNPNLAWSKKCRDIRMNNQQIGREKMLSGDKEFAFGCALLWGEGDKSRNSVALTNTDEKMMAFWVNFLKKYFDVKLEEFSIRINCYLNNNFTLNQIQQYWVDRLGLKIDNVKKASIKNQYYGDIKNNKHPYGVCRVLIGRTDIVQQLYGAIKQMIGDNTDRWIN